MILNYSTTVNPHRSVAEIQGILGTRGCRSVSIEYDERGEPSAISFGLAVGDFVVPFRLPRNSEGVLAALKKAKNSGSAGRLSWKDITKERAEWISWRILKDWIEAQMALVEAGQAEVAEVFLPYAVSDSGETVFQRFLASNTKQLTAGTP